MTSFNPELSLEEATKLFNYRGATMFPDTKHNRQMMASIIHEKLQILQNKK